jgi:hypothetical protein
MRRSRLSIRATIVGDDAAALRSVQPGARFRARLELGANDVFVFPAGSGPSPGNVVHPPAALAAASTSTIQRVATNRRAAATKTEDATGNHRINAELSSEHDDLARVRWRLNPR